MRLVLDFSMLWVGYSRGLDLSTFTEYLWQEADPAVRFTIDNHVFLLERCEGETRLLQEGAEGSHELARLSDDDPRFEDRLLVGIGDALQPQ